MKICLFHSHSHSNPIRWLVDGARSDDENCSCCSASVVYWSILEHSVAEEVRYLKSEIWKRVLILWLSIDKEEAATLL